MLGGDGHDRISGDDNPAGSRDVFEGGSGDDTMAWNPGDDDDTMDGQTGTDTVEVNGGGGPEQFTVKPSPTAGRVQFDRTGPSPLPGPFNLDIGTSEKLGMNAGGGDDSFTADAGLDALGLELDVDGGPDNDTIDGGDGADSIGGGDGNDTINADDNPADTFDLVRGDAGDDIMIWNGGDDNDVNDGALATTPPGSTGPPSARSSRSGPGRPRDGRSSSASTRPRSAGSRSTSEPRRFST
jgi:hypothetical protein